MSDEQTEPEKSDWFRELLDRLGEQADEMIADLQAQDALSIDLAGQV